MPNSRSMVLQQCRQCRRAGRMKRRLPSAQTTRSKTISCKGQAVAASCRLELTQGKIPQGGGSAPDTARGHAAGEGTAVGAPVSDTAVGHRIPSYAGLVRRATRGRFRGRQASYICVCVYIYIHIYIYIVQIGRASCRERV